MKFKVVGKHNFLSKEEIRAMLHASASVLEFHNGSAMAEVIVVKIVSKESMGKNRLTGGGCAGQAFVEDGAMGIANSYDVENTLTVVLHEMIHLMLDPESELATSTLTAKLLPAVTAIYNTLIEGVYQRSAFIAHTKIAYKPKDKDGYNKDQWKVSGASVVGKRYRKNAEMGVMSQ